MCEKSLVIYKEPLFIISVKKIDYKRPRPAYMRDRASKFHHVSKYFFFD